MLEPPPPTENPLAQHVQLIEALYMQINLLAEVRDAIKALNSTPAGGPAGRGSTRDRSRPSEGQEVTP